MKQFKKYRGFFTTQGGYIVEVSAKNKEEAEQKFIDFNFGNSQIVEDYRESEYQEMILNN
jgi:hypothetical protein